MGTTLGPTGARPPVDKLTLLRDVSLVGVVAGQTLVFNGTTWVPGPSVTGPGTTVDSELVVFSGTTGTIYKRSVGTGVLKLVSGVYSTSTTTSDLPEGTNLYYTDARVRLNRLDQMTTPTANVSYGGMKLVNLGTPTGATDAATKGYVDGQIAPSDANIAMSDITTNNVSTTKHGFAPKLDNNASHFLDGTGNWSTPAGGAGGGGDFSSNTAVSVDSEVVVYSGVGGKTGKRATGSGLAKLTSGVLSTVSAPVGALVGTTDAQVLTNKKLGDLTTNGFVKTSNSDGTLLVDTTTYLSANQVVTLSGDVTGSGATAITATIANAAVTYAKMQNVSATSRVLGRKSSGAGSPEELQLTDVLDFIGSAAQGDTLYRSTTSWARLPAGTAGQVLTTQGVSANPTWTTPTPSLSGYWDTVIVLTSDVTNSTTTLTNITGLTVSLLANSVYEFEFLLLISSANVNGVYLGANFSTSGASLYIMFLPWGNVNSPAVSGTSSLYFSRTFNAGVALVGTEVSEGVTPGKGYIVTGTNAGDMTLKHSVNSSGSSTAKKGSVFKIKRVV